MNHLSLALCLLVTIELIFPASLQSVQSRHYRPSTGAKCDRHGRCAAKEGYIEETVHEDEYKSEKDRPAVLTRDDWPNRPLREDKPKVDTDKDESLKSGGGRPDGGGSYGGAYNPKPVVDREDGKPEVSRNRDVDGVYSIKPVVDGDDIKSGGGGGYDSGKPPRPQYVVVSSGSHNRKPDRDDDLKPPRPSGGYNPKPLPDRDELKPARPSGGGSGYGGGYIPKPVDRDDNVKPTRGRPSGGGGSYDSGYNPKPVTDVTDDIKPGSGRPSSGYNRKPYDRDSDIKPPIDRDDYDIKPKENKDGGIDRSTGGHNPKPGSNRGGYPKRDEDDYNINPARGGGGYYPDDDRRIPEKDLGGFNKAKDDEYNEDDSSRDNDYDDGSKPIPLVNDGNCICVPYYQCQDGHIVTDGAGIIDARKRPDPDDELPLDGKFKPPSCGPFHVCCNTPETSTVKPYEHRCGVRNPSGINSRILSPSNKGEADFGEWPWQAAVLKAEGKVNIFQCGGVIIDKYHVLTVAHCVFHLYQYNEYPLKVRLGEWDTQTTTEFLAHEDYRVSKIIIHPEYRNTSLWNDIAVLRLQDPVLFAPHIDTVCLPKYDEVFDGQNCVVTGWGKDAYKGGTFSNVMKEVALQVIDNYKCEEMLRKTRLGRFFQLHEGFVCAGGEYGLDSCKGDGGGPLVCYRKDKSYALAGIVSWGIDCGQPGVPGVYVKIQKYLDWISKTTGVNLQEYWPK